MLPVRCRSTVKIGDRLRVWGCGAVLINGEWCFQRPGSSAQDGAICPTCSHLLHEAQRKARVRLQRATERKAAQGFGPFDGDAFR